MRDRERMRFDFDSCRQLCDQKRIKQLSTTMVSDPTAGVVVIVITWTDVVTLTHLLFGIVKIELGHGRRRWTHERTSRKHLKSFNIFIFLFDNIYISTVVVMTYVTYRTAFGFMHWGLWCFVYKNFHLNAGYYRDVRVNWLIPKIFTQ